MDDERTIDELIEIAAEIPDRLGLSAGMTQLRGTVRGEGVSVTVDVQGMLVGLEIDEHALALGPEGLAAEISRLSAEAGTKVLQAGLRAIRAGCGPAIADAVGDYLGIEEDPAGPGPAESEEVSARPGREARRPEPPDDEVGEFVLVRA
ncbi:MAG TPA: hypothetical protein VJT49_11390 [Amycolatopsis sp.]|uniref:hypothetical protein n=1 Tax=Amycolatopsis sp. TaxID=37632 RepID=UPI002B4A259F|nr:hypothetical protein [Amycolatopsis sp.]HKS45694.1 hypothetical protein [Amycolatopsis sp.]